MQRKRAHPGGGESSLHAALKKYLRQPDDLLEADVEGYRIDILRGETLIEIQTRNFSALKPKLAALLPNHPLRIVYPVAEEKWIVRLTTEGEILTRRKSPKRGALLDVCRELVYVVDWLDHPNLSLDVLFIHQEDIWCDDGKGSWRRKGWSVSDRRLLSVLRQTALSSAEDFAGLLPPLAEPFTSREVAAAMQVKMRTARQLLYTLQHCGSLEDRGKRGRARLYSRSLTESS